MNRNERAKAAQDTLTFFKQGFYRVGGKTVNCTSTYDTEFTPADKLETIQISTGTYAPKYEVVNESVIDTVFRLTPVATLNFASAKNPGRVPKRKHSTRGSTRNIQRPV